MIGIALLQKCASEVAPVTMAAIVQTESSGWPWTINVNGLPDGAMRFSTKQAAVMAAVRYIRMGYKVDMGLAQVDSENLSWLGLSVTNVFNPCSNLKAAQRILVAAYRQAGANGTQSLGGAFQVYNSGNTSGDGHYARVVYHQAGVQVPAIPGGQLAPWTQRQVDGGGGEGKRKGGRDLAGGPPHHHDASRVLATADEGRGFYRGDHPEFGKKRSDKKTALAVSSDRHLDSGQW